MAKRLSRKPMPKVEPDEAGEEKVKRTKIRVIGIGGGGGNIVSELAQRVERATFVVANTDSKALKETSRKVERFSFGQSITHGLGTGMNPEVGEIAAQNEKERIKKISQGQDLVILVASLGGGVGSGASQVFAQISKKLGNLTYGIFTLPFRFEGEKKMEIAKDSLNKIKSKLNALTIIPNERIFQVIDKTTPLKQALSAVNKTLSEGLEGLIETIYEPGLINIDFADLKTILEGRGRLCYLNTLSFLRKEGRMKEVIEKALNSPLYSYGIRGARAILYNIAGEKELNLEEVKEISKAISEKVNKEAKVFFGVSHTKKYGDNVKITIFATGLPTPHQYIGEPELIKKRIRKKRSYSSRGQREGRRRPRKKTAPRSKKVRKTPKKKSEIEETRYRASELSKGRLKKRKKIKPKKVKIKVSKKSVPEVSPQAEVEVKKENQPIMMLSTKRRKNGLQLKKETEEVEKEMLEREKFWETPAFLRQKKFFRTG